MISSINIHFVHSVRACKHYQTTGIYMDGTRLTYPNEAEEIYSNAYRRNSGQSSPQARHCKHERDEDLTLSNNGSSDTNVKAVYRVSHCARDKQPDAHKYEDNKELGHFSP